jgi:NADPH-dependent glutamate synthase beta subunit-like oxidoreductase/Pyruvate/2-oxoacid:ferredoxin oxidoreductase delta subunit
MSMKTTDQNGRDATTTGGFRFDPIHPEQLDRLPPCRANCPSGANIRDWIAKIAQHDQAGLSKEEAYAQAWSAIVEYNPFPATMGRICPHPCEADCNRKDKDGAVAVNALERFIGDWAIEQGLSLSVLEADTKSESVGVIGAGPAGLSFAYQMQRRGYAVTVYDRHEAPGGMLRFGIPDYRLPPDVLNAEVTRITDLGVRLEMQTRVGTDLALSELQSRHHVLFIGLGAQTGRHLGVPGEGGTGIWTGTDFLKRHNSGENIPIGTNVVVVGGGNTAIDVARVARRKGADVTILYRRTREAMPAIDLEIDEALKEGVRIEYLSSPTAVVRTDSGDLTGVQVQRMRLCEPDNSGRPRPVPIEGAVFTVLASSIVTAISQEPDWSSLDALHPEGGWLQPAERADSPIVAGGDVTGLNIASHAIAQGRVAAERIHARLRGLPEPKVELNGAVVGKERVKTDFYPTNPRVSIPELEVEKRMADPTREVSATISEDEFLHEVGRCLSCGSCFGCQHCWMYCNGRGFTRLESPLPGRYFALSLDLCEGCGKCIDVCPCGYLGALGEESRCES